MAGRRQLEFFILRYVPNPVRNEFVNFGLVMFEPGAGAAGFAEARFARNWERVRKADPRADIEMLDALENDIRRQLAKVRDRETLLRIMEDSFSNVIQVSPKTACLSERPEFEIEELARTYLEAPRAGRAEPDISRRRWILGQMRNAFEQAGVWALMDKEVAAARYTHPGDPLKIDCAYRPSGIIKMFQAVSIAAGPDVVKALAFSYPRIVEGVARVEKMRVMLTAVVESDLGSSDETVEFALATMESTGISIVKAREMPVLSEVVRRELHV